MEEKERWQKEKDKRKVKRKMKENEKKGGGEKGNHCQQTSYTIKRNGFWTVGRMQGNRLPKPLNYCKQSHNL
jgi:hypothetical protein